MPETIYLQCTRCGTMKPCEQGDPDDILGQIDYHLDMTDCLTYDEDDGHKLSTYERVLGLSRALQVSIGVWREYSDRLIQIGGSYPRPQPRCQGTCWVLTDDDAYIFPIWGDTLGAAAEQMQALYKRTLKVHESEHDTPLALASTEGQRLDGYELERCQQWDDLGHRPTAWETYQAGYVHACTSCEDFTGLLSDGEVAWDFQGRPHHEDCAYSAEGPTISTEAMEHIMAVRNAPAKYTLRG